MCCGLLTIIAAILIIDRHWGNNGCYTAKTNRCNDYYVNTTVHHFGDECCNNNAEIYNNHCC